jgi:hypothetical protein
MPDVDYFRYPKDIMHRAGEGERVGIGERLADAKLRARERMEENGFDEETIGEILGRYDELEDEELARSLLFEDLSLLESEVPVVEIEPDYLGSVLGMLLEGFGQQFGRKLIFKD